MEHIYIFTVNSLAKTFATVDAGHDMRFRFESSNQGLPTDIQEEDLIIGFVGAPPMNSAIVSECLGWRVIPWC